MLIDKATILQALEELAEYDLVDQARNVLPDRLDSDEHRHLFLRFGVDPRDLGRALRTRPGHP